MTDRPRGVGAERGFEDGSERVSTPPPWPGCRRRARGGGWIAQSISRTGVALSAAACRKGREDEMVSSAQGSRRSVAAVQRTLLPGRGGAVRQDLPAQWDHAPAHGVALADHDE